MITRVLPTLLLSDAAVAFDDCRVQFTRADAAGSSGGDVIEALYVQRPFCTHQVRDGGRDARQGRVKVSKVSWTGL